MSSAERKTTGSTFMIGCVVKTKERLHEQRRKKTTGTTILIGCVVKTKERLHEQRRKEDNWVNFHDRMCGKNQRETT